MRTRLAALLVALMSAGLVGLGVPLAWTLASTAQREVYVDRLADAARFASLVRQVSTAGGDLAGVTADLRRYEEVYGIRGAVLDRRGRVLASSRLPPDLDDGATAQAVATALTGRRAEPPAVSPPWRGAPLVVTEPVVQGGDVTGVVVTASPTDDLHGVVLRQWALLAGVMALAVAAAVALSVRLAGWVLRPVRVLDEAARAVGTGRLGTRVPEGDGPPELRHLAAAFNEMADGVEALVQQQRAFVADASHQLRNPLSALLLRLEEAALLLPSGWEDHLDAVRDEGRRLAAVLDELLQLARAENAHAPPVPVDARAALEDRAAAWRGTAARRGVVLAVEAPSGLRVLASPAGLTSALDALVDNAVKFSPDGGRVLLAAAPVDDGARGTGTSGAVLLSVRDSGPGLEEEELLRAGDRFWRSARHTNVPGSGLGLAVARALVERWGGVLDVAPAEGGGLRVGLLLRAAPPEASPPRAVVRERARMQLER